MGGQVGLPRHHVQPAVGNQSPNGGVAGNRLKIGDEGGGG